MAGELRIELKSLGSKPSILTFVLFPDGSWNRARTCDICFNRATFHHLNYPGITGGCIGIRTLDRFLYASFQDWCLKPLGHTSVVSI